MVRLLLVSMLLVSVWPAGLVRADIPSVDLRATRAEDDRVRLDLSIGYYLPETSCSLAIERRAQGVSEEEPAQEIFSSSGEVGRECGCYLRLEATEPVADATGQDCEWNETMYGTCPEPFLCHCTIDCEPIYDAPCNGEYIYAINGYLHHASSLLTVDWRQECNSGCGCTTSEPLAHATVLLMFLLAFGLPGAWGRWRCHRRHKRPGRRSPVEPSR